MLALLARGSSGYGLRGLLLWSLLASAAPHLAAHEDPDDRHLVIELVDQATGQPLPGCVQIRDAQDQPVRLPELLPRGLGVPEQMEIHHWWVLPKPATLHLPAGKYTVRAISGLETCQATAEVDLTGEGTKKLRLPLRRFFSAGQQGWQNANTHVHLMKSSRQQSDQYLVDVSRADGLDIVFISYLERAAADLEYTTNKYTHAELHRLSTDHVHFGHGEEHRHNFSNFEEGYGHVMFLNLPELVLPASLGPGITLEGHDGVPLSDGIEFARGHGAKVIWCHNKWGLEDIPNWLAGRLHANNIFDGGTHGSYAHSFYRYLNAGLQVPFSTGTDWFIYDFSRVYIRVPEKLKSDQWLERLAAAESYITNGPLLEFDVDGQALGQTVRLPGPRPVRVRGTARGRLNFEQVELVQNSRVIHRQPAEARDGYFEAKLDLMLPLDGPCWLALRTPPPSAVGFAEFNRPTPRNEYGRELFGHTSALFVDLAGQRVFDRAAAQSLLEEMQRNRAFVDRRGLFLEAADRRRVLQVYDEGIAWLQTRLSAAQSK